MGVTTSNVPWPPDRPPKFRWIARREDVESERNGRVRAGIRTEISAPTEPIRGCTHAARRAAYFDKSVRDGDGSAGMSRPLRASEHLNRRERSESDGIWSS